MTDWDVVIYCGQGKLRRHYIMYVMDAFCYLPFGNFQYPCINCPEVLTLTKSWRLDFENVNPEIIYFGHFIDTFN